MAPPVSKGTPILSASELLGQRQETVNRLKGWSALSETQFDVVFLPLILAFAGYVQALPHGEQGTILDVRLQQAERVLRRRRGVILPSGAEPEQIAREEDLWTYAVFSIALLRRLARDIDAWEITLYSAHHQAPASCTCHLAAGGTGRRPRHPLSCDRGRQTGAPGDPGDQGGHRGGPRDRLISRSAPNRARSRRANRPACGTAGLAWPAACPQRWAGMPSEPARTHSRRSAPGRTRCPPPRPRT